MRLHQGVQQSDGNMLRLGYNTSAFAHVKNMTDIIGILYDLGYAGLELTLDRRHFHPHFADGDACRQLARHIATCHLELVLSVGGRYVLSDVAHEPSLVSATAAARQCFVDFMAETIQLAPMVGARTIMLHSGSLPSGIDSTEAWQWLIAEVAYLADAAQSCEVRLGFEFHPAMFIATLPDYRRLKAVVGSPALRLTLDVGHVVCTDTRAVSEVIADCADEIVNVHLEDIKGRKHVHLPIGHGDIDFTDVFRGLKAIGYRGLINAEFNTDDLEVDECQLAQQTFEHLRQLR